MGRFAKGKNSQAISDRSGQAFPYSERVKEWNGSIVHISEFEAKHPQLEPNYPGPDPTALYEPRPNQDTDLTSFVVYTNAGDGIIGKKLTSFEDTSSLGEVTVSTS